MFVEDDGVGSEVRRNETLVWITGHLPTSLQPHFTMNISNVYDLVVLIIRLLQSIFLAVLLFIRERDIEREAVRCVWGILETETKKRRRWDDKGGT